MVAATTWQSQSCNESMQPRARSMVTLGHRLQVPVMISLEPAALSSATSVAMRVLGFPLDQKGSPYLSHTCSPRERLRQLNDGC